MAISTSTISQAPLEGGVAVVNFATDAVAATAQTISLGFTPRIVRLLNVTDLIKSEWTVGMAAASKVVTTALGAVTYTGSAGFTVASGAVTIDASLLVASKTYSLVCER